LFQTNSGDEQGGGNEIVEAWIAPRSGRQDQHRLREVAEHQINETIEVIFF